MSRHRESTTPMDFEYDNQIGRVDPKSPFLTSVNPTAKKRKLNSFASQDSTAVYGQELNSGPSFGQPGTHSVFDSPSKSAFTTPNRPQLRDPQGQHFLFSDQKPLPSIPNHVQNSKVWEPRTPHSEVDFSSGGETPNTPAQDSDAATPDTQLASRMGGLSHAEKKSPKKSRRESLFKLFSSSPSPSKEDPSRKLFSKKAENRVMKRRSKKSKNAMRDEYDSDTNSKGLIAQQTPLGFVANVPGVLAWVEAHPNLPAVLSYYMQFLVNMFLGFFALWIVWAGYSAVVSDINIEAESKARDIMHQIAICTDDYRKNNCDPRTRVPALEQACNNWQRCMNQDAMKIARASVGARTFAMIFNSFVEEFSYKSMLFTCIILFGGFNLSNWAFGFIREKHQSSHPQYPLQQHHDYPPATPQRYPSNGYIEQQGWGNTTPFHTPYGQGSMGMQASQSLPALITAGEDAGRDGEGVGERMPAKRLGSWRR